MSDGFDTVWRAWRDAMVDVYQQGIDGIISRESLVNLSDSLSRLLLEDMVRQKYENIARVRNVQNVDSFVNDGGLREFLQMEINVFLAYRNLLVSSVERFIFTCHMWDLAVDMATSKGLPVNIDGDVKTEYASIIYWATPVGPEGLVIRELLAEAFQCDVVDLSSKLLPGDAGFDCARCKEPQRVNSQIEMLRLQMGYFVKEDGRLCKPCLDRIAVLKAMPNDEYWQTPEWAETRTRMLHKAGGACQLCNSKSQLNVHHRTYDRKGFERDGDLIVLCRICHATFHGRMAYPKEKAS